MTPWTTVYQAPLPMRILQVKILEWVAMPSSRGIYPTQGLNPGLLHCRWILYKLSHQGSPQSPQQDTKRIYFIILLIFKFWPHLSICRILVPRLGIELSPSAMKAQSLNHWIAWKFPKCIYFKRSLSNMQILDARRQT